MKVILLFLMYLTSLKLCAWTQDLRTELRRIDQAFEGEIGVSVKDLQGHTRLDYNTDENWYLSSTMKIIVALSLLEEVEAGRVFLNQKVTLKTSHFVDRAGTTIWASPGETFTVSHLLKVMLRESDNTAADILIGLIGTQELDRDFKRWLPGAGKATSLLEVRYLAYGELHPKARALTNMDFVELKNTPFEKRHITFAKKIGVPVENLRHKDLEEAHESYYTKGYNSAGLDKYVDLLEKLVKGKILNGKHTKLMLNHMAKMSTGDHRIRAGLSTKLDFYQKTGTQVNRACNVGIIKNKGKKEIGFSIAVCLKKKSEDVDANRAFKEIGKILSNSILNN